LTGHQHDSLLVPKCPLLLRVDRVIAYVQVAERGLTRFR